MWTLVADNYPQVKRWIGGGEVVLGEGQRLQVRCGPPTEEFLDVRVPQGKVWKGKVSVVFTEEEV